MYRKTSLIALAALIGLGLLMMVLVFTVQALNLAVLPSTPATTSRVTASTPTTITLVSSPNPAAVSQTVTFTATVYVPPRSSTSTGTVQFKADGANLGAAVNLSGRKANLSTSWSVSGTYTITAVYSGDVNFSPSTSASVYQCIECSDAGGTNETNSFILSNEPPSYLIHKLVAAGYGSSSLYSVTLYLKTLPGADTILTNAFINALAGAPAGAEIFTRQLSQYDFDGAVAVSDDGTVRIVDVYGQDYNGKSNTTTLRTENLDLGKTNFVYSNNSAVPLTSWIDTSTVGPITVITTHNAFAVAWGDAYMMYIPLVRK